MTTVSLSGAWLINDSWTVRAGLGVILDGELKAGAGTAQDVNPGGLAAVGLEYVALVGDGYTPFIDLSLFLSGSMTETTDQVTANKTGYFATDLRFGTRAGWNVNGNIYPYMAARIFGGPVNWALDGKDVTGNDIHHYQFALGMAIRFGQMSVYGEWAGFGEQALSAGLGVGL